MKKLLLILSLVIPQDAPTTDPTANYGICEYNTVWDTQGDVARETIIYRDAVTHEVIDARDATDRNWPKNGVAKWQEHERHYVFYGETIWTHTSFDVEVEERDRLPEDYRRKLVWTP